jgi:hypothetical protein
VKLVGGYGVARLPHGEIESVFDCYAEADRAVRVLAGQSSMDDSIEQDSRLDAVDELMQYWYQIGRICPMPQHWNRFWELLSSRGCPEFCVRGIT